MQTIRKTVLCSKTQLPLGRVALKAQVVFNWCHIEGVSNFSFLCSTLIGIFQDTWALYAEVIQTPSVSLKNFLSVCVSLLIGAQLFNSVWLCCDSWCLHPPTQSDVAVWSNLAKSGLIKHALNIVHGVLQFT